MMLYLGLGTNLGDREEQLRTAVREIEKQIGKVVSLSAFYVTEPWGFVSEHPFLNAAAGVETSLSPWAALDATQDIERRMGRRLKSAGGQYADRLIDIDLLLYDDWVVRSPRLVLPHPLMDRRLFVLQPLAEIASDVVHPLTGRTIGEMLRTMSDE